MKKTLLSLGSVAAIAAPVVGVVACSETTETKSISTKVTEALKSKVIVLSTTVAAQTGTTQAASIVSLLEKEYGLVLLKGHTLMVKKTSTDSDSTGLVAVTVTTDDTAVMVYVTVNAGANEVVKNVPVKIRKNTAQEINMKMTVAAITEAKKHITTATKLVIDISDINAISSIANAGTSNAWTDQELSAGIALAINTATGATTVTVPDASGSINVKVLEIKPSDALVAVAASNAENTIDLTSAKEVKIELTFGSGDDIAKEEIIIFVISQA